MMPTTGVKSILPRRKGMIAKGRSSLWALVFTRARGAFSGLLEA